MHSDAPETETFEALYDRYFARLYAYVRYRVASDDDAEDLVAETFLRVARSYARFTPQHDGSLPAWLFRIAHNLISNHYRDTQRRPGTLSLEAMPEIVDTHDLPEEAYMRQEELHYLRRIIGTLAPRQQEIITLRFFADLRNQEIADILGLDARTVAAYLSRGLAELQRRYAGPPPADGMAFFYGDDVFPTSLSSGLRQPWYEPLPTNELPAPLREVLNEFTRAAPEARAQFRRDLRARALEAQQQISFASRVIGWVRRMF
jgi:RNA polymerase sigma-70 factor, ECF subfamily